MSKSAKKQSCREKKSATLHFINTFEGAFFPGSKRIYLIVSQNNIRVPVREITLSATFIGGEPDAPQFSPDKVIPIYDTSGPYDAPDIEINVSRDRVPLRNRWIADRCHSEALAKSTSGYAQTRFTGENNGKLRFKTKLMPRRAKKLCITLKRYHYSRDGVCSHP